MKSVKVVAILVSLVFQFIQISVAQTIKENEIVVIEGQKFILHQVRTGETLSSISRDFNVERSALINSNPNSKSGIFIGEILKIPYREGVTSIPASGLQKGAPSRFENHTIESRNETPYFIARKYGINVEDIYTYNPGIKQFNRGAKIRIPIWNTSGVPSSPIVSKSSEPMRENGSLIEHKIASGETLWGIAHKFNVSEAELKAANPILENGFPAGVVIQIPVKKQETSNNQESKTEDERAENNNSNNVVSSTNCQPLPLNEITKTTFDIALFLPLFLETNYTMNRRFDYEDSFVDPTISSIGTMDNDSVIEVGNDEDKFIGFYRNTEDYLQFYEGVLLAVDSMQKRGMKIKLNVFDTQQNPETARKILSSDGFLNTDLIIGPVFPNEQKDVSAISAKNRIPMISPLSDQTGDVNSNPYFFQVNPDRDFLFRKTAEMVARDFTNCNFIVFKTGNYNNTPEAVLVDLIREKLNNSTGRNNGTRFMIYDFKVNGIAGLRAMLSSEKENVIFIPSSNEGELSIGMSNLNNLANEYQITLIGTNRYPRYESIQIEYFHNLKLTYVAPYWTDYENSQTVNFMEKFKRNYYTEPNNFGQQGYDVTFYFLNALKNYGRDFRNCLPELKVDLIQGNYRFEKVSSLGGYMNQGVSVITYTRNYNVVRKKIDAL